MDSQKKVMGIFIVVKIVFIIHPSPLFCVGLTPKEFWILIG